MPKYIVDVEQTNYGITIVAAESKEEAMEIINSGQPFPDEIYTGSAIRSIRAHIVVKDKK